MTVSSNFPRSDAPVFVLSENIQRKLKNTVVLVLNDLYTDFSNLLKQNVASGQDFDSELKSLFLKEFKQLPGKFKAQPSFLCGSIDGQKIDTWNTDYAFNLAIIKFKWNDKLQQMTEQQTSIILDKALKKFKPEYYATLHPETPENFKIGSEHATITPPLTRSKKGAIKAQRVAQQIVTPKEKPPETPVKKLPPQPKNIKSVSEHANTTPPLTKPQKGAIKAQRIAKQIVAPKEIPPATTAMIPAQPHADAIVVAAEPEIVDVVTIWTTLFQDLIKLKEPSSMITSILLCFERAENEPKLRKSVQVWSAILKCIAQLTETSPQDANAIQKVLRDQFLCGNQDFAFENCNEGRTLLSNTLPFIVSDDDILNEMDYNCLEKYLDLIIRSPHLIDFKLTRSFILPIVDSLTKTQSDKYISLACDLILNSPLSPNPKLNKMLFSSCRQLIVIIKDHSNDSPILMKKTLALLDILKGNENFVSELTHFLTWNPHGFARHVLVRAFEIFEQGKNTKDGGMQKYLDTLTALSKCINDALNHASIEVFRDFRSKLEQFAATLKKYCLPYEEFYEELVRKQALVASPEDDPKDAFKGFRSYLDVIGSNRSSLTVFSTILTEFILTRSNAENLLNESILKARIDQLIGIANPNLPRLKQPLKGKAFREDPKMILVFQLILKHAKQHPNHLIHYANVMLGIYREWANEIEFSNQTWFAFTFPKMFFTITQSKELIHSEDPHHQEQKILLKSFWRKVFQSFILKDDFTKLIKEMIVFTVIKNENMQTFANISIDLMDDDFFAGIESFQTWKAISESKTWTIGGFTETVLLHKLIWEFDIDTENQKQKIWHILSDYYIKFVERICLEFPDINHPERKKYIDAANAAMNVANKIIEQEIKNSLEKISDYKGDKITEIRKLHSQMSFYQPTITKMLTYSLMEGSPGYAFGILPIQFAFRLFNNVLSSTKEKLPILKDLLIYATEHVTLFSNDKESALALLSMTHAALRERIDEYYIYDPSKGFKFGFTSLDGKNELEPTISSFNDPKSAKSLLFLNEQLSKLNNKNSTPLTEYLTQNYWNDHSKQVIVK